MATDEGAITWIARVRHPRPAADLPVTVRLVTSGASPGPDTEVEEIDDPFADPAGDPWARVRAEARPDGLRGTLGQFELAPPVRARTVFGIGRNYRAHAEEMGNEVPSSPLVFLKAASCLLASGQPLPLPRGYERIDMESELVVVVGRGATGKIAAADAWDHVAGYTLGVDVSNRDLQKADKQWTRAKGSHGFGPVGPFIRMTPPGFEPDVASWRIRGFLDDQKRQDGCVAHMIFDIPALIEHLSESVTLEPGDLIYTGTPEGVSALSPGQVIRVELEGFELGRLTIPLT